MILKTDAIICASLGCCKDHTNPRAATAFKGNALTNRPCPCHTVPMPSGGTIVRPPRPPSVSKSYVFPCSRVGSCCSHAGGGPPEPTPVGRDPRATASDQQSRRRNGVCVSIWARPGGRLESRGRRRPLCTGSDTCEHTLAARTRRVAYNHWTKMERPFSICSKEPDA